MQKKRNYPLSRRIIRFLKRQFRNPGKRLAIELAAVVAIIGIVIFMALSGQDIATDDVKDGIAYIEGLEAQDTAPIEEEVKNLRKEERKQALESGRNDFIDCASLMKHCGHEIHMVECAWDNIKITTPSDYYIFRAILEEKENSQIFGL